MATKAVEKVRRQIDEAADQLVVSGMTPQVQAQLSESMRKEIMATLFPHGSVKLHSSKQQQKCNEAEVHVTLPSWLSDLLYASQPA